MTRPRWWWPLALCALLGAVCGAAHGLLADRQYAAGGQVLVTPVERGDAAAAVGLAQALGRVATGEAELRTAAADAGVPAGTLRSRVRAVTSPDAPVIEITGTAGRPEDAARAANAVARALVARGNDAREGGAELSVLAEAHRPSVPTAPVPWVSVATGLCAGVVVGGAALAARGGRAGGGGGGAGGGGRPGVPARRAGPVRLVSQWWDGGRWVSDRVPLRR
ncbi:YveK family protein [Streptomyces specialis]|uniref:lipopolysaccharide biosynthesis protein n=1 Tax=Streptomyces specialis TaxID=498367 RepID=UPI000B1A3F18|nr:lipopolysaccharide biosynthesis protein [Streptomyces specialis]